MKAWEEFLRGQEQELGKKAVDKWLRPLKVVHFDAANLYLEATDPFQLQWFEEQIRPKLVKNFRNNNHRPITVHLSGFENGSKSKKIWKPVLDLSPDQLDPQATFSTFIGNSTTVSLLQKALENPSTFNPLSLHGPEGSGKSHLLMAAAHFLQEKKLSCLFIRGEKFTEHLVAAIRNGAMEKFRALYRSHDALCIDDLDIFAKRSATQEEFFHTFNTLHSRGKQMIFTVHTPPGQLADIEPRLTSRLEWGLVLPLKSLEGKEREALLETRAQMMGFPLSSEVKHFLLTHFVSHPRSLVRALDALILRCHLDHIAPEKVEPARLLTKLLEEEKKRALTPYKIVEHVAAKFGLSPEEILSRSQTHECSEARKIAMALCRERLKLSYPKIGEFFSRDHSTVMSNVKAAQILIKGWPGLL